MKKFIAFALAAVVATVTQSAQVEWSSGDLGTAIANKADINGVTAYYYAIDAVTYTELAGKTQEELYYTYFNADGTEKTSGSANAEVAVNDYYVASWTQNDPTLYGDPANTAYVVAIYKADSDFGGTWALASVATATFESGAELGMDDPVSGTFSEIGATKFASDGWAAVPEPTTVALLALGLAAVGLKRKVA